MLSISHTNNKYIFVFILFFLEMYVGCYGNTGCPVFVVVFSRIALTG